MLLRRDIGVNILRNPLSHADNPFLTAILIGRGHLSFRRKYWLFGEKIVAVTRKGRRALNEIDKQGLSQ